MISDLMALTNNYFEKFYVNGEFVIENKKIILPSRFVKGQYIRIIGSLLNDGVYKIEEKDSENYATLSSLLDETFTGYIVGLAVPQSFQELAKQVDDWNKANASRRGLASESSLNGYYSWSANAKDVGEAFANEIAMFSKPKVADTYFLSYTECINE